MALDTSKLIPRRWFGKNCYWAEDVNTLLVSVKKELDNYADMPQRLADLTLEAASLREACAEAQQENQSLTRQLQLAQQELVLRREEAEEAQANLRQQIAEQQSMLERARKRESFLNDSLEQQRREIADFENFANSDPVTQAYEKAQKILADAQTERERILQEYTQQRAKVTAATRSAYYNALQFKMALAKRYSEMEKNLDETIDVLRMMEASPAQPATLEGAGESWTGE